jgi:hypothetical protein
MVLLTGEYFISIQFAILMLLDIDTPFDTFGAI